MTLSVYRWEDVHRYFPQEVIEQYKKKIIEERKSGKFKDREIWELYGMSENAFYDLIKRYSEEGNLKDKSSRPKNPSHKLDQEEMQNIINKAREDRDKFNDVLQEAKYGYNHRPNSAFNYKNPLEVMATKIPNLRQQLAMNYGS